MEGEGESSPSRVSGGSLSKEVKRMDLEHQFPRVLFKTREAGWRSAGLSSLVSWTGSPWFCHLPAVSPLPKVQLSCENGLEQDLLCHTMRGLSQRIQGRSYFTSPGLGQHLQ